MKRISLIISSILLMLSLASCSELEVKASEPVFTYNNETIEKGTVETVVENTYDSTVSIRANVSNYSYSMGSGTFISYDESLGLSYVLTCYHVIEGASSYQVILSDQETTLEATLVGGDPATDIALLSVCGTDYTYATISTANDLRLGSQIVIIGNPLGTLPGSVTSGYVSYLNREVLSEDYRTMTLIQTDASINSGNSGGAMFDLYGRLVGVVNAKYVDEGVEGLGFAIPISTAQSVVESVLNTAVYSNNNWTTKGYLVGSYEFGFSVSDYASMFGQAYIAVSGISNNSTASGYGMFQIYDEITAVSYTKADGTTGTLSFSSSSTLMNALYSQNLEIGDTLTFTIVRNRQQRDISFEITQFIPS